MGEFHAGNIVRCRTGLLGDRHDAIGWHVDKSGVGIDEAANQPGTGDAVDLGPFTRNPC
jgi:hypothetical protein